IRALDNLGHADWWGGPLVRILVRSRPPGRLFAWPQNIVPNDEQPTRASAADQGVRPTVSRGPVQFVNARILCQESTRAGLPVITGAGRPAPRRGWSPPWPARPVLATARSRGAQSA